GGETMATTRIMPLHTGKGRTVGRAISSIIDYVENPAKTDNGRLITSWQCDSRIADAQFLYSKRQYIHNTGRMRGADDIIAYHLRQSFVPGEITPEEANRLGVLFARRFTKENHAFIVCTHIDKHHIHNHIIWNSVALSEDRKFQNFWGSAKAVRRLNDTICIENGYSVIENPNRHGKSYNKWLGDQKPLSHRERICFAIDEAMARKPENFDVLLAMLRQAGFEVKGTNNPSIRAAGQKRYARMDTLGEGYSAADLRAAIAGDRQHKPKERKSPKNAVTERKSGNLLIDIQAKLQEGKGAGYANWAKKFNLKQMAQTVAYIQEHDLTDYAVLAEKSAAASSRFNELSETIKTAEKRMAEISVLRTQIINYAKTRETYAAYRKAGYSKKFLAEHESEISIHKAAKKCFDDLGITKLPSVKSLQTEYAELMTQKKAAYSEYRKAREEMKELLTAKANIDRILEKENERDEQRSERKAIL
ncbi:MAG: relaxase/mobilization nuclease domain-containing protein, partial [Synergistes sp.]|nr:relaxase/mobilization nuclease domain-containing protein [Synergistes sp.]